MKRGNYLQEILFELNLSQAEMAEKLGISKQQINNIISDKSSLTQNTMKILYNDFNVNLNYLLSGVGDMFNNSDKSADNQKKDIFYTNMQVHLTERELEVLQYICNRETNREIALKLGVTYHTVKAHVSSVMQKMNVKSRAALAWKCKDLFLAKN